MLTIALGILIAWAVICLAPLVFWAVVWVGVDILDSRRLR